MSEQKERPTFEFHFHDKVGQNIANVEHMEVHFDKDMQMQVMHVEEVSAAAEKLGVLPAEDITSNGNSTLGIQCVCLAESNVIFNTRILIIEDHYRKVRDVILRFIRHEGVDSGVEQINPSAQNEWYYIMKGIRESGIASSSMGNKKFAEQMVAWFPDFFAEKIGDGDSKAFIRNFTKCISAEHNKYWTEGIESKEVTIINMHAHARTRNMDCGKVVRAFNIANGLKKALEELKTEIQKAQSAR